VAGYGTRLYPATRRVKKEMMPLIDRDGLVKPAILILLEQLHEAGIEEICLVVGSEEDIRFYQDYFQTPLGTEHLAKLPEAMLGCEQTIRNIGNKLVYRIQHERRGFGHAVYQCRDFAGGEPVLLLLGDTVYSSGTDKNCTQQLIEDYEALEKPLVAIHKVPLEQVSHYGILSGTWEDADRTRMEIARFVEKPIPSMAKKELVMMGRTNDQEYYAVFGQYILPPEIFTELQKIIETTPVDIPESMVRLELDSRWRNLARRFNTDAEGLYKIMGGTPQGAQSINDSRKPDAVKALHSRLIVETLIEDLKFEAGDEEVDREIEKEAAESGAAPEDYKKYYEQDQMKNYLKEDIKERKLFDKLLAENTIKPGKKEKYVDLVSNNG
jgi:UTP-glucose-1-phosphate uridylyltransferase